MSGKLKDSSTGCFACFVECLIEKEKGYAIAVQNLRVSLSKFDLVPEVVFFLDVCHSVIQLVHLLTLGLLILCDKFACNLVELNDDFN